MAASEKVYLYVLPTGDTLVSAEEIKFTFAECHEYIRKDLYDSLAINAHVLHVGFKEIIQKRDELKAKCEELEEQVTNLSNALSSISYARAKEK